MKKMLALIISVVTLPVMGLTLSYGWNTFVLRVLNLPKVNAWTALGLVLIYELIVWKYEDTSFRTDDEWIDRAWSALSTTLTVWAMLFIVSLF
ncbi:MAG: hypothetical protein LKK07_10295 [Lactococcus lactis]|jgi:hypothetical protein|nr:hypothetical protein [Lactococcus lactis]MCI2139084.1 hypothetical protein [Lactococcus lactis]MCI2190371.1 hypothetical protein [Lactococcus lactis]